VDIILGGVVTVMSVALIADAHGDEEGGSMAAAGFAGALIGGPLLASGVYGIRRSERCRREHARWRAQLTSPP